MRGSQQDEGSTSVMAQQQEDEHNFLLEIFGSVRIRIILIVTRKKETNLAAADNAFIRA